MRTSTLLLITICRREESTLTRNKRAGTVIPTANFTVVVHQRELVSEHSNTQNDKCTS